MKTFFIYCAYIFFNPPPRPKVDRNSKSISLFVYENTKKIFQVPKENNEMYRDIYLIQFQEKHAICGVILYFYKSTHTIII